MERMHRQKFDGEYRGFENSLAEGTKRQGVTMAEGLPHI